MSAKLLPCPFELQFIRFSPQRCEYETRHCRYQLLTFSPFARHVAHVVSICMDNHRRHGPPKKFTTYLHRSYHKTSEAKKEQSESSDEEEFDGTVQADFAFFDPKPDDCHGVKPLLQTYLDDRKRHSPCGGTVAKIEADEDNGVFALATALNLERYKARVSPESCQEKDVKDDLRSHLGKEAKSVGHLVSQRLTNLPLQLLPPLYDAVFDEVSWDTEDDVRFNDMGLITCPAPVFLSLTSIYFVSDAKLQLRNAHQKKGVSQ
ncbi:hypothetical protein DVH24_040329 [Malus domestica]|uniref:Uncharacterized protein n=1 Tax=Malus domestica TaxID=3750 RepID=A0A498IAD3_MALDO|nr:hypothetical protein DVH24_040329 [Malus domestica]